jgi:hypothetical protein
MHGRGQGERRAEPLERFLRAVEALLGALDEDDAPLRVEVKESGHGFPPRRDGHVVGLARRLLAERDHIDLELRTLLEAGGVSHGDRHAA